LRDANGTEASSEYGNPQMAPDGRGGFFIGYFVFAGCPNDLIVYCYKDEGGRLKSYGGGQMNQYGKEEVVTTECGSQFKVSYDCCLLKWLLLLKDSIMFNLLVAHKMGTQC
jgi:hypothetical protein